MPLWIYVEMGFTVLWSMLYIIGASIMTQWGARQCYQLYVLEKKNQCWHNTVWKFMKFSATQILREINVTKFAV